MKTQIRADKLVMAKRFKIFVKRFGPLAFLILLLPFYQNCSQTNRLSALFPGGINANTSASTAGSGQPSSQTPLIQPNPTLLALPNALPVTSTFAVPAPNACRSKFDKFYISEPGVYAYWGMCEAGTDPIFYDYAGEYDLNRGNIKQSAWGALGIIGGAPGPVADGETASTVTNSGPSITAQNIIVNVNEGTIGIWANADVPSNTFLNRLFVFQAVSDATRHHNSVLGLFSLADPTNVGKLCYTAKLVNSVGNPYMIQRCGITANSWHRLVMTWSNGTLNFFVDSTSSAPVSYTGTFDQFSYFYSLFTGSSFNKKSVTLAKAFIANQAWGMTQVIADFNPNLFTPPSGGVYITNQALGTIHRDVLGYADFNSDLSTPARTNALIAGLKKMGVTSVRYAGGAGGIAADQSNWKGGQSCAMSSSATGVQDPGVFLPSPTSNTNDTNDVFIPQIAQNLGIDVGYTVNYGSDPNATCSQGGDPKINGADAVSYLNGNKKYGIKYWEIGNEQYSPLSELDYHENPNTGASYAQYEPAFFDQMKAVDNSIQIGIPSDTGPGYYSALVDWSIPAIAGSKFDALVFHNYPLKDPITDGDTLYMERVQSNTSRTRAGLLNLQTILRSFNKSPDSIWVTEWDADPAGDKWSRQSAGAVIPIFATMQLAEYMRAGVPYATWWAQGHSNGCLDFYFDFTATGAYNWYNCGGSYLVYTGAIGGEVKVGLKPGDVTPAGRAFQILSESGFVKEGEHMLETVLDDTNSPWLQSYAATHGSSYAVILINRDRDTAHTVPVQFASQTGGGAVLQWTYGRAQYDQSYFGNWSVDPFEYARPAWNGTFQATLPPWSVNVFVFGN